MNLKNMNSDIKKRIEQINSGQVPEGYKKEHGFILPQGWDIAKLKHLFDRVTEKNTINNDNVLTISAQHGLINQQKFFKKNIASKDTSGYYLLQKGDFAYNKSYSAGFDYGTIKKLKNYEMGVVSTLYICFKPKEDIKCSDYFEHYFDANLFNSEIHAIAQEGARNHGLLNIGINDFFNCNIINPPQTEQQNIAEILSTCDRVIELKEDLLTEKQKQKKWLMRRLLTGEIRLKGFSGEWKEYKLDDIGSLSKGSGISKNEVIEEGIPCIRYGEIYTDYNFIIKKFKSFISAESAKSSKLIKYGDILFAGSGETAEEIGKSVAYTFDMEAYAGGDIIILSPNKIKVDSCFLSYVINKGNARLQLNKLAQGNSVVHIYPKNIAELKVILPSFEEQKAIAEILTIADKELDLLQKEIDEYKQLKKSLMQLLLTGVVRVLRHPECSEGSQGHGDSSAKPQNDTPAVMLSGSETSL